MKKYRIEQIVNETRKSLHESEMRRVVRQLVREALEAAYGEENKPKRFIIQTRTGSFYLNVDYPNSIDYDENTHMLAGYVGRTPVAVKVSKEDFDDLIYNHNYCEAQYRVLDKHDSVETDCVLSYDNTALNEKRQLHPYLTNG